MFKANNSSPDILCCFHNSFAFSLSLCVYSTKQMKALLDDREKAFRTLILECLLKRSDLSGRNLLTSVYIVIGMVHVRT